MQSTEGGPSAISIDNFGVQMNNSKSNESLLYVHVPATSDMVDHYCETTEVTLSADNACSMAANANGSHSSVAYETRIRTSVCSADKSSFEGEDQVHCQLGEVDSCRRESLEDLGHGNRNTCTNSSLTDITCDRLVRERNVDEILSRADSQELCCRSVDHEPGTENPTADVSYYITGNSAYGASNRARGSLGNKVGNLQDFGGNMAGNVCPLPEVDGERLASGEKSVHCNECDGETQNEDEKISVESRPGELVPDGVECHPSVRVDVDNVGLVSVTTSDVSSKTANNQEGSVSLELDSSENTFGLKTSSIYQEEMNVGGEEHGNTKRKKKARLWKGPCNGKKKTKVSIVQFVRIEPKPFVDEEASKNKQGVLKQNR